MQISAPYLLFLGDVHDPLAAKTAQGVLDWRREWCLAQMRLPGCGADLGLPEMQPFEAAAAGAKTFVLGAVNAGGRLPEHWVEHVVAAIEAGLDVASGLHIRLGSVPAIATAASHFGRTLHDLRVPNQIFPTGKGTKRIGKRLLTVGTDCSVGKKYTALALERDMRTFGMDADFRATGQTGILISGKGVPLDAVVADFIAGAAEWLTPESSSDHWDIVEGQGSLFHPSFAGVTLGLLHGTQPDAFVVCHEPTRQTMRGVAANLPSILEVIEATVQFGRLTNPGIACVGISVDTSRITERNAHELLAALSDEHKLPVIDPIRFGTRPIIDRLRRSF